MQITVDENIEVMRLALACAAGGLSLSHKNGETTLRQLSQQELTESHAAMTDVEVLAKLRTCFVAHTPIVRECIRRFEAHLAKLAEIDAELEKWEGAARSSQTVRKAIFDKLAANESRELSALLAVQG